MKSKRKGQHHHNKHLKNFLELWDWLQSWISELLLVIFSFSSFLTFAPSNFTLIIIIVIEFFFSTQIYFQSTKPRLYYFISSSNNQPQLYQLPSLVYLSPLFNLFLNKLSSNFTFPVECILYYWLFVMLVQVFLLR